MLFIAPFSSRILEGSVQNVSERNESGALESASGRFIAGIATSARNCTQRVGFAFEFLDEVGAKAFAAFARVDLHVDVAVGAVVMEKKAAFGDNIARQFEHEFGAALALVDRADDFLVRCGAAEHSAVSGEFRRGTIAENDGFGGEVAGVGAGEDEKKRVVRLNFDKCRPADRTKCLEQRKSPCPEFRQKIEFNKRWLILPWAGDCD